MLTFERALGLFFEVGIPCNILSFIYILDTSAPCSILIVIFQFIPVHLFTWLKSNFFLLFYFVNIFKCLTKMLSTINRAFPSCMFMHLFWS